MNVNLASRCENNSVIAGVSIHAIHSVIERLDDHIITAWTYEILPDWLQRDLSKMCHFFQMKDSLILFWDLQRYYEDLTKSFNLDFFW